MSAAGPAVLRVALIGATGQLGCDLGVALRPHQLLALGHADADVRDRSRLAAALAPFRPDVVVSTAAYHDVDRAEAEVALALAVNAEGAWNVASLSRELDARLVWISTDYVFSGRKGAPYLESDPTEPLNAYGASKVAGEALIRATRPSALIVRSSALYGHHPCRGKSGLNFVEKMLKLAAERGVLRVVDDEVTAPTPTELLARSIAAAIERRVEGLLHLASAGQCSWFEFASAIITESGSKARVERALPGEFASKAPRPACSVLASERVAALGLEPLPHWREGLRGYLGARGVRA